MSQIATAYIVSGDLLNRLGETARRGEISKVGTLLASGGLCVLPEYEYSGSVLAVVIDYAEEQGLPLPLNQDTQGANQLIHSDATLVLCAAYTDADSFLTALRALPSNEDELAEYFEAFAEETWDEAGAAMQAGLAFLRQAFEQLQRPDEWLLLFIG